MATYQDMQDRIADEMQRDDLGEQTQLAIQDAIKHYQLDAFYISDKETTITGIQGQQSYNLPSDFVWMREVWVQYNFVRYILNERTYDYVISEDTNLTQPVQGSPLDYGLLGGVQETMVVYPRPDGNSTIFQLDYVSAFPTVVLPTDAGFWMNAGEAMVRNRAKGLLYMEVTNQPDLAQICFARADAEHFKLREMTAMQKWTASTTDTSEF
jgi:hypothetical protein